MNPGSEYRYTGCRSGKGTCCAEIFGPLLPVRKYDSIDGAIGEVNRRDRPLALYYFGSDEAERRRVLDRTISGGVSLDDTIFHVSMEELPFGGIGPSGMGAYHGEPGISAWNCSASTSGPRRNAWCR